MMIGNDSDDAAAQATLADDALRGIDDSEEDGGRVMSGLNPMWAEDTLGGGHMWNLARCNSASAQQGVIQT